MSTFTRTTPADQFRPNHARLIWALAAKDITDALKNKATLTVIVMSLLMVLFYRYFPLLASSGDAQDILVYAPATEETLVEELMRSPALAIYTYDSPGRMQEGLRYSDTPELGLVIPAGALQTETEAQLHLDGYVMNWLSEAERIELTALVESELALQLDRPVTVSLENHELFMRADDDVINFSASISLIFVTLMIGISLVPHLMIEEKQARTLDVLRVSPATSFHLVAGKGVAALFYGLLGCLAVLFAFSYLVVDWGLVLLAIVLSVLFMAGIGLLLGSLVEARAQLQLVAWFVVIPLMFPIVLYMLEGLVPTTIVDALNWVPTVTMARIFSLAFTNDATWAHFGPELALAVATTLLVYGLLIVVIRRQDRR